VVDHFWSAYLSVCHDREPCKNRWTDWDAVWVMDSKEACIRWRCTLATSSEYDWTVHMRQRCSLFVKLLWPLVTRFYPRFVVFKIFIV